MLFKKDLIDKVLNGSKTMTSRSKPLNKVGDITNLMANKDYSAMTGKYIKITAVYEIAKFFHQYRLQEGGLRKFR